MSFKSRLLAEGVFSGKASGARASASGTPIAGVSTAAGTSHLRQLCRREFAVRPAPQVLVKAPTLSKTRGGDDDFRGVHRCAVTGAGSSVESYTSRQGGQTQLIRRHGVRSFTGAGVAASRAPNPGRAGRSQYTTGVRRGLPSPPIIGAHQRPQRSTHGPKQLRSKAPVFAAAGEETGMMRSQIGAQYEKTDTSTIEEVKRTRATTR